MGFETTTPSSDLKEETHARWGAPEGSPSSGRTGARERIVEENFQRTGKNGTDKKKMRKKEFDQEKKELEGKKCFSSPGWGEKETKKGRDFSSFLGPLEDHFFSPFCGVGRGFFFGGKEASKTFFPSKGNLPTLFSKGRRKLFSPKENQEDKKREAPLFFSFLFFSLRKLKKG